MAKHYGGGSGNFHVGLAFMILAPMIFMIGLKWMWQKSLDFIDLILEAYEQ